MSDHRLPSGIEAAALIRKVQGDGDFATILRKGDPDRGALLLVIASRGRHFACLERILDSTGNYRWTTTGPSQPDGSRLLEDFLAKRARFDEDSWLIELDVAHPERFIAETTAEG